MVISADTIITFENKIYEKPRDSQDAFNTLKELKGKTHIVMTAVCVKTSAHFLSFVEETKVTFGPISDQLIQDYVATGDPMDKAGSYGYQSLGGALVNDC